MTVFLKQIGDIPLSINNELFKSFTHSAGGEPTQLAWSERISFINRQYQIGARKQSVTAKILTSAGLTAGVKYRQLQALTGLPVEIIGFELEECIECGNTSGACIAVWYETIGRLDEIALEVVENEDVLNCTINVTYSAAWRPLNRLRWRWGPLGGGWKPEEHPPYPYKLAISGYPRCDAIACECGEDCDQFVRTSYMPSIVNLEPEAWVNAHAHHYAGYPATGQATGWHTGVHSLQSIGVEGRWNHPPTVVFAATKLPQTGSLEIHVGRKQGPWGYVEEYSTLDLSAYSTLLTNAGLGGLFYDDKIYLGNLGDRPPGFLVRNGFIIEFPRPPVKYSGAWPGFMSPGPSQFEFKGPNTSLLATMIEYRRS